MATSITPPLSAGKLNINNQSYNLAPVAESYKMSEIPAHSDVDQQMERRVIYRSFSNGILHTREENSVDATSVASPSYSYFRQTRLSSGFYWANGCDTRLQDRIFPQRKSVASNYSSALQYPFLIGDASVYSWAVTGDTVWVQTGNQSWAESATITGATITDAIQWAGHLYVGIGSSSAFWSWDQASPTSNWVQNSNPASYWAVIRNQLWRAEGAGVYSTTSTDPTNLAWDGVTIVGDPNSYITGLDVFQDFLMVFKQDGIYSLDKSGNVYPIYPAFKNMGANPRPIGQWQNNYYFASDVGLIWQYALNGDTTRIGFDRSEPYPMDPSSTTQIFGVPNIATRGVALTNYLIVGFNQYLPDSTSNAYFLAWDGSAWHPFQYYAGSTVMGLGYTGGTSNPVAPVLQFSVKNNTSSTCVIYYMDEPLVDSFVASSFDTTPQVLYMPVDNGALEDEYKVLERYTVWVDNPTAGTVRLDYATDDDITGLTFRAMAPPIGDQTTGRQIFVPSIPFPNYLKILTRITITANTSSVAPQIRWLVMHYKQRVPQRRVWDLKILADQNIVASSGRVDVRSGVQMIKDLKTARDNHQQVIFVDITGEQVYVYVDQVGQIVQNLKGDQYPSFILTIKLVESMDNATLQASS